jgi:hypothetical protein
MLTNAEPGAAVHRILKYSPGKAKRDTAVDMPAALSTERRIHQT